MTSKDCCILNAGSGSWAFERLALQLSDALWVDVADRPRRYNYLLFADEWPETGDWFIPRSALEVAADKRLIAEVFATAGVPMPETRLVPTLPEALSLLPSTDRQWCLKYPTGCGAAGHRLLTEDLELSPDWPLPLVVQEFVPMQRPEVYRIYAAGGETFGWVARRFPVGAPTSPWVAHARGARYQAAGDAPAAAVKAARAALLATHLLESFGCADLIQRGNGEWLVLEVGTDGVFNHVDRDLDIVELELQIQRRIADAFWRRFGEWRPWGSGMWRQRNLRCQVVP